MPAIASTSTVFLDKIIWFIIRYSLLFDTINGFFLHSGKNLPVSQSLKIILLIFIVSRLLGNKYVIPVFLVLCYAILLSIYFTFIVPLDLWGDSINHVFKFLSVIIYFCYFYNQIKQKADLTLSRVKKVIKTNTFILVGNILIGLLGLGYAQYNDTIGFRGYFYAGNEVSGVLLLLFPFTLYQINIERGIFNKKYLFYCLLFLFTGILTITKTAILGTVLTLIFVPFMRTHPEAKKKRKWVSLTILLALPVIGFILYYGITQSGIIDRWLFFYEQNGIWSLLSGRDSRVEESMYHYLKSDNINMFLGLGGNTTVEMDPFDTLFNYGILGMILVYGFYFSLLFVAQRHKKRFLYAPLAFFCNLLVLFASSFSGHILFSGMAGIFIALINSLIFYKPQSPKTIPGLM